MTGRVRARHLNDTGCPGVYIKWEKPTKAILDHFTLDNVTLLGISMGGYLCLRAAAFEPSRGYNA